VPIALLIGLSLVVTTTLIHYELLRLLSANIGRLHVAPRSRLVAVLLGTFFAHALEIALYALAYYYLRDHFGLGSLGGEFADRFASYLYFSAESYTSLGLGDIYPTGPLRLLTGFEALNGLLLIGWSASFTYLAMQRYWRIDDPD
jgi:hypothetical protein